MITLRAEVLNANGGTTAYQSEGNTVAAAAEALIAKLQSVAVKAEDAADAARRQIRELQATL